MENWGLIVHSEISLLQKNISIDGFNLDFKDHICEIVTHEVRAIIFTLSNGVLWNEPGQIRTTCLNLERHEDKMSLPHQARLPIHLRMAQCTQKMPVKGAITLRKIMHDDEMDISFSIFY